MPLRCDPGPVIDLKIQFPRPTAPRCVAPLAIACSGCRADETTRQEVFVHTITSRQLTADEQRLISARAKPEYATYGCLVVFFALVPAIGLGLFGAWVGSFLSAPAAMIGLGVGCCIAALVFLSALVPFIKYDRRRRKRALRDNLDQVMQVVHVTNPRVIEIGLINDDEPVLAFDIGEDTVLFLRGQWLRDCETYGVRLLETDAGDDFINGLPAPHSFPSTEFTLSRFPNSGEVVSIRVQGSYLAPQSVVDALKPEYEFGDSELLTGSLKEIAAILAREHARRKDSA